MSHFFVAYPIEKKYEKRFKYIARHYMKSGYFYIELLANIPWEALLVLMGASELLLNLSRIVKLLRVVYWWKVFQRLDKLNVNVSFLLLLMVFALCAHFLGSIWHSIGYSSNLSHDVSWIGVNGMQNAPTIARYIACYYWALMTISTIG